MKKREGGLTFEKLFYIFGNNLPIEGLILAGCTRSGIGPTGSP